MVEAEVKVMRGGDHAPPEAGKGTETDSPGASWRM